MKKIIAFTGSTNPDSIHEKLVQSAIKQFDNQTFDFIDLKSFDIPIYSQKIEAEGIPQAVKKLYQRFISADGFLFASPEHNGLPSAFLKNTIDWLSRIDQRFFGEKPVLLLSTSPGATGGKTQLQILENLIPRWGGNVIGLYSLGNFLENFDEENLTLKNPSEKIKLGKAIKALINEAPFNKKNNAMVIQEYFTAFHNGDVEGIINSFHADCYIVSVKEEERPKEQLHGIYRTRKEAKQFVKNIHNLFNTKDFSIDRIIPVDDNLVISNGTFSHEVKATGKIFKSTWVQYCTIVDEKIKEYRFYEDSAAFVEAFKQ